MCGRWEGGREGGREGGISKEEERREEKRGRVASCIRTMCVDWYSDRRARFATLVAALHEEEGRRGRESWLCVRSVCGLCWYYAPAGDPCLWYCLFFS